MPHLYVHIDLAPFLDSNSPKRHVVFPHTWGTKETAAACSVSQELEKVNLHAVFPHCAVFPVSANSHAWTLVHGLGFRIQGSICDQMMQDLPPNLLPYLRLGHCTSSDELRQHGAFFQDSAALPPQQEAQVLQNLASCLQQRLQRSAPVYPGCLLFIAFSRAVYCFCFPTFGCCLPMQSIYAVHLLFSAFCPC